MRLNYYEFPEGAPSVAERTGDAGDRLVCGCSVTEAKRLLREFGGVAWTEYCERDGNVFEVTDIELSGNNGRFKYNHHL